MTPDPYEVLGVARDATTEEIKAAYRKLSKQHHPDREGCPEIMRALNDAYETLSDPEKRRRFDEYGDGGFDLEREAEVAVCSLFAEMISVESVEGNGDLVQACRKVVRHKVSETTAAIANQQVEISRYDRLSRRLKRKAAGVDFFAVVCNDKIRAEHSCLAELERLMKIHARVLELLQDYEDAGVPNTLRSWGIDVRNGEVILIVTGGNRGGRSGGGAS